jgi:hypothetical protein
MSPRERQALHRAYERFQSLPPKQREALKRKWRSMSPQERRQWMRDHPPGGGR